MSQFENAGYARDGEEEPPSTTPKSHRSTKSTRSRRSRLGALPESEQPADAPADAPAPAPSEPGPEAEYYTDYVYAQRMRGKFKI